MDKLPKLQMLYVNLSNRKYKYVFLRQESVLSPYKSYEVYRTSKRIDLVINILRQFSKEQVDFYNELDRIDEEEYSKNSRRINRYFSKSQEKIGRKSLNIDGYWLIENPGGVNDGTKDLLKEACKAVGIKFGNISEIRI